MQGARDDDGKNMLRARTVHTIVVLGESGRVDMYVVRETDLKRDKERHR